MHLCSHIISELIMNLEDKMNKNNTDIVQKEGCKAVIPTATHRVEALWL